MQETPRHPDEFEVADGEGVTVILTEHVWKHIIDHRGLGFAQWWEALKDTVREPDFKIKVQSEKRKTVYIRQNNSRRKYKAKYLCVIVDENNMVKTAFWSDTIERFKKKSGEK